MDVNSILEEFAEKRQIPIFGVASASGFEQALPGWHPKDLMPRCDSVLVFGRPFVAHSLTVDEATHIANEAWWTANEPVYREIAKWRGEIMNLLDAFGLGVANFGGFGVTAEPTFSYRLAQYEAGLGVYGRFGVCLHPEFGCYYSVGVLLTEAKLRPSDKGELTDFAPCEGCRLCAEECPVKAIDASQAPAQGNDRELCMRFILRTKRRHKASVKVCSRCFIACPWARQRNQAESLVAQAEVRAA